MKIYLDNAATTAMKREVIEAMTDAQLNYYGNPSSVHSFGRKARSLIEEARKKIAQRLHASIGEIIFTSGGTESNNTALKCSVRDLGVKRIISSPIEHHCVLHTCERLAKEGVQVDYVEVDQLGRPNYDHLKSLVSEQASGKTLVSLMHANNEVGTLLDLEKVASICEEHGAMFHSDTVQSVGYIPIDLSQTKISFISGSAHKFHGPKGVGFLYVNANNIIQPFIDGGSQERNVRAGTENLAGIIGLAKAFDETFIDRNKKVDQIRGIKEKMKQELSATFDCCSFHGDTSDQSVPTILNVSFDHPKGEMLLMYLDIEGIAASGGSACSSGATKGSHVISHIDPDSRATSIRFSFSDRTTTEEIEQTISVLKKILG